MLKLFAIQAVLLIFIFFLAIATLDLVYAPTLCFFFGKVFGVTGTCFTHAAVSNFSSGVKGGRGGCLNSYINSRLTSS